MNDKFTAFNELNKLTRDLGKFWFTVEKFWSDSVNLKGLVVDSPLGINITVKMPVSQPAVDHLHTADLNHSMAGFPRQAGGLGIKKDLAHRGPRFRQPDVTSTDRLPDLRVYRHARYRHCPRAL